MLKAFDWQGTVTTNQGQGKYPWHEWANGKPWAVNQRDDFPDVSVACFKQQLRNKANRLGSKVQITDLEEEGALVFQFFHNKEQRHIRRPRIVRQRRG